MGKVFYNTIGFICVVLGLIGVFLPLLPTTPFAILASIMFAKTSPKMQARLKKSKLIGPYLQNYYEKTGIALAYKIRTVLLLWSGLIFSAVLLLGVGVSLVVYVMLGTVGTFVSIHLFAIKTKIAKIGEYKLSYNIISLAIATLWLGGAFFFAPYAWVQLFIAVVFGIMATGVVMFVWLVGEDIILPYGTPKAARPRTKR